jgi:hypothetical protein
MMFVVIEIALHENYAIILHATEAKIPVLKHEYVFAI